MPKYPDVVVELDDENDDDASAILSRVKRALAQAGVPDEEIEQFTSEATAGDYDHLRRTVMAWVEVV
jgi:hypothetical protein